MVKKDFFVVAGIALLFFTGCASSQVERVDVQKTVDLSGMWNDTDSRTVAKEMIEDAMHSPWVNDFRAAKGRAPVVIVGPIKNQTEEHVNTEIFTKNLENSFVRSGLVKVVASRSERLPVRQERNEQQQGLTEPETVKKIGKETGADFILSGSVNTVKDEYKGRYVIMYQANLELLDLENNQKVWIGQTHLKKIVKRSKYSL